MPRQHPPRGTAMRAWLILTEASALSSVAVMPYVFALQKNVLEEANKKRHAAGKRALTPRMITLLSYLQSHVTFGAASAAGLFCARIIGLPPTFVEERLAGTRQASPPRTVALAAASGVSAALVIEALDYTVFTPVRRRLQQATPPPAPWRGLLAALYGAIGEEVLMRLGAQTICAAGIHRVTREQATPISAGRMWAAIALSSGLFGVGHLPATKALAPLTPLVVLRALVLNGVAGTVFGYLYWQRGLGAAMVAHGSADLILHVGGAALARHTAVTNGPERGTAS